MSRGEAGGRESSKEFITLALGRGNRQEERRGEWGEGTQIIATTVNVY